LQVISSLLYLQSKNIEDEETFEMFLESQSRLRSMALVHEGLYQSKDLTRVDFAEYVRSLANYLFRSYGVNSNVIRLKTKADDVFLGVDTAVPCGLILNELVSNSLKHAFPDGREGEICIELRADNDSQFTLMVRDNGAGLPEDLDFRDTQSLGLQLVNTLVDQLEGTIELDKSDGTAFEVTFTVRE
jgi:two-component sensor histidine kinase